MPARNRTLLQLRGDIEFYADLPVITSSTRPTLVRVLRMINESLYDFSHRHKSFGTRFKTATIAATSGTTLYDLASDFAAMRYLRYSDGGRRFKIRRGDLDMMDMQDTGVVGWKGGAAYYMLMGKSSGVDQILFTDPRGSYTVTYGYVPELEAFDTNDTAITELSADTDYILSEGGIDTWVALDVAIKIKAADQADASELMMAKQQVEQSLQAHLADRDVDEPERVRNTWDAGGRYDDDGWDAW